MKMLGRHMVVIATAATVLVGIPTGEAAGAARAWLPVIRFHDLRHTFATLSLKVGIPTEVVSRILGHRNPVITQVFYQHAVPCLEEDAIARFAALVDGSRTA